MKKVDFHKMNKKHIGMNKIQFKTRVGMAFCVCLLSFGTLLTSCSSDNDEQQDNNGRRMRQLTITDVPLTRVILTDNTNTLGAIWTAGDKATLLNVSAIPSQLLYGEFTASTGAATSVFTGSISCDVLDKLAIIYPKVTPVIGDGQYTIDLSGQQGTLEDVATRYHYIYGVGEVTYVTDGTANANISSMKSLLAVCKFTFKDKSNNEFIPVKTLSIQYADNDPQYGFMGVLCFPLTGTVTPSDDAASVVANAVPQTEWKSPLVVTPDTETADGVYVALFPVADRYFHFTVTNSNGTYTGTAKATLNAGKYYPVTIKLNKQ